MAAWLMLAPMMPARHLACSLFGLVLYLVAPKAQAWGDEGHRVIGEIAWRQLTPSAQRAVSESLTEPGYESLAEAATWPDTFARRQREYDAMKPFHYVNVAPAAGLYQRERDCPNGCVVTALSQFVTLLESNAPALRLDQRRTCIYWIAHLVGDLHQPLHVAHPDGKGGNVTSVRFFDEAAPRNAHWVWDVGLLERRPLEPGQSPQALASALLAGLHPGQARRWQRVTAAETLATESLLLARRHAYLRAGDAIDQAYEQTRWPIVADQLRKAGFRLAAILNRALDPASLKP